MSTSAAAGATAVLLTDSSADTGARVGMQVSITNAAAVLTNTSTSTTVYLTGTTSSSNGNTSLNIVSGIYANMGNNAITATTFVGALSGTASAATNAAAVQTNTSTSTTVYLAGTTSSSNGNTALNIVSGIYANMGNNSITATTFVGTATSATNAAAVQTNTSTSTTVYLTGTTSGSNGNTALNIVSGIYANMGNNAITATTFVGNISGNATNANYANYAGNAFSVDGSNVNGYVANATHATIADSANSVAVANVVGIGNIAVLNLTGDSSNVLYGNGSFAPISLATNANYANYATHVIDASQPNITSLGTLSSLGVEVERPTTFNFQKHKGMYNYCPRDLATIIDTKAIVAPMSLQSRKDDYKNIEGELSNIYYVPNDQGDNNYNLNSIGNKDVLALNEFYPKFDAANIIRANKDILF